MSNLFTRAYQNLIKKLDDDIAALLECGETWWVCSKKDLVLHLCPKPSNKGLYIKDKNSWVILFNIDYLVSKNLFCAVCRDQCPDVVVDIYKVRTKFE